MNLVTWSQGVNGPWKTGISACSQDKNLGERGNEGHVISKPKTNQHVLVYVITLLSDSVTPWIEACQAPLSMGIL